MPNHIIKGEAKPPLPFPSLQRVHYPILPFPLASNFCPFSVVIHIRLLRDATLELPGLECSSHVLDIPKLHLHPRLFGCPRPSGKTRHSEISFFFEYGGEEKEKD